MLPWSTDGGGTWDGAIDGAGGVAGGWFDDDWSGGMGVEGAGVKDDTCDIADDGARINGNIKCIQWFYNTVTILWHAHL